MLPEHPRADNLLAYLQSKKLPASDMRGRMTAAMRRAARRPSRTLRRYGIVHASTRSMSVGSSLAARKLFTRRDTGQVCK